MNYPQRKANRLPSYDYAQNGRYFITICTKNKEMLLGKVVGGDAHIAPQVVLTAQGSIAEKYLARISGIDCYVVMPNHIHFIINIDGTMWASSPTQSVSQLVQSFKTLVSKECAFSVWQRSFYDHIIRDDADYLKIWNYIDTNPARWEQDCFFCA